MGLLSSITKKVTSTVKTVATAARTTANIATNIAVHPVAAVKAATSGVAPATFAKTYTSQPLSKQVTNTVIAGAGYIAAAVTAGAAAEAIATKGVIGAASSLIPASTGGKIAAAVAAPVVLGAVLSAPKETLSAVAKTPQSLGNIGTNIGTFAANPNIDTAKQILTDNPVLVAAAVGTAAIIGAKGLTSAAANVSNTLATRSNTEAVLGMSTAKDTVANNIGSAITPTPPITPQTVSLEQTPTPTATNQPQTGQGNKNYQKVNVLINQKIANRTKTTKYINKRKHR